MRRSKNEQLSHTKHHTDEPFPTNQEEMARQTILPTFLRKNWLIPFVFLLLLIAFFFHKSQENVVSQSYIGGNVLKIPLESNTAQDIYYLANPWKNCSFMANLLFSPLFLTDATFTEIEPGLAENLKISSDNLSYSFRIKDNLLWSDGVPLTAEDVIFSFEAFLRCDSVNGSLATAFLQIEGAVPWQSGQADSISGITLNGNEITIKLATPYQDFALMLTQFAPLPKHILEHEDPSSLTEKHPFFGNDSPVTSGLYLSEGLDDDYNITLTRNPNYFGKASNIEKIQAYWDWENIEVDYFATTDVSQKVNFRQTDSYTEFNVDVFFYRYFFFNLEGSSAARDKNVRQAINHGLDISALFKEFYLNAGTLVYGGSSEFSEEIYPYDPEIARKLLEDGDYDFDHTFVIGYYNTDETSFAFLEKTADYLEELGMNVELQFYSSEELYENPSYDMLLKGLSSFDSKDWYREYLSNHATASALLGQEGLFDPLVNRMISTSDPVEIEHSLRGLVELEQELLYKLPLFTLNQSIYVNTSRVSLPENMKFGNVRYHYSLNLDEWSIKTS